MVPHELISAIQNGKWRELTRKKEEQYTEITINEGKRAIVQH
jgi:hypothetical protein